MTDDDSWDSEENEGEENWLRQGWRSETGKLVCYRDEVMHVRTRQHRKALWHNGCPSHNLLRHLTLTHDHDNKRGEGMHE